MADYTLLSEYMPEFILGYIYIYYINILFIYFKNIFRNFLIIVKKMLNLY